MNLIDKLIPQLILAAALVPTLLLLAAAAVSLSRPDPSIAIPASAHAAAAGESCWEPGVPAGYW